MAEIISRNSRGRGKNHSTRVDLTPMVDLGFLLITFFVFTTSLAEPKALRLFMPADDEQGTNTAETGAVTIIPAASKIFYYNGQLPKENLRSIGYGDIEELRSLLFTVKKTLSKKYGDDDKMMVMIKPAMTANLSQVVDMLDEMAICSVPHYTLLDLEPEEEKMLNE